LNRFRPLHMITAIPIDRNVSTIFLSMVSGKKITSGAIFNIPSTLKFLKSLYSVCIFLVASAM